MVVIASANQVADASPPAKSSEFTIAISNAYLISSCGGPRYPVVAVTSHHWAEPTPPAVGGSKGSNRAEWSPDPPMDSGTAVYGMYGRDGEPRMQRAGSGGRRAGVMHEQSTVPSMESAARGVL